MRETEGGEDERGKPAAESSNINVHWTFPGVTIKPLVLLKLESEACDWLAGKEKKRRRRRKGLKGGRKREADTADMHSYI